MFLSCLARGASPPTLDHVPRQRPCGVRTSTRSEGNRDSAAKMPAVLERFNPQARGGQQRPLPRRRSRGENLGGPLAALRVTAYCAAHNGAGGEPPSPPLRVTVVAAAFLGRTRSSTTMSAAFKVLIPGAARGRFDKSASSLIPGKAGRFLAVTRERRPESGNRLLAVRSKFIDPTASTLAGCPQLPRPSAPAHSAPAT